MIEVLGVILNNNKMYYFYPNDIDTKINDYVIVETNHGLQLGQVVTEKIQIKEIKLHSTLKKVIKKADAQDVKKDKKNKEDAKKALKKVKEIVDDLVLDMQIIEAFYTFDRSKLIIRFLADSRIDFRQLAKELATIYKTRIELRQIGPRDKAKEIGGFGMCGRNLCCSKFLIDLDSVSINMAKNQNISLNPNKINGCCGRLLCCLKYEDECYSECRERLPQLGKKLTTEDGIGKVVSIDILKKTYEIEYPDKGIIEYKVDEEN